MSLLLRVKYNMSEGKLPNKDREECGLCNNNDSKYCCPRCGVFYCSLNCYKSTKHLECSESFYRDCVNQELATHEADDESKRKMIDILKKMQNADDDPLDDLEDIDEGEEDSDDELVSDLHSRVQNINLNDADAIWSALTNDERNEFEALINGGDVASILPPWQPWWLHHKDKTLVEEISNEEKTTVYEKCPVLKKVSQFETLTNVKPSPAISYNISNILASYAFIMRYFNGDIDPVEGASYLLDVCSNLKANVNFEDLDMATEAVAQSCLQSQFIDTDKESIDVMKHDTLCLLRGPCDDNSLHYAKAALSDLIEMFTNCKKNLKLNRPNFTNGRKGDFTKRYPDHVNNIYHIDKSQVNKVIKKLEFYLSFLNCNNQMK